MYKELPNNFTPSTQANLGYLWIPTLPNEGVYSIGDNAVAFGNSEAHEYCSFATGEGNIADGRSSFVSGMNTNAGYCAHAEGVGTTANGKYSHAEGGNTVASADFAHAEGYNSSAIGAQSHAEGTNTTASSNQAHAEGSGTTASGTNSHSEGANTTSSGMATHAEGSGTTASGNWAHAEGINTTASKPASHAEGNGTLTGGDFQHVQGKFNIQMGGTYADVVGWGSNASTRKNISALDTNGNLRLKGDVYVGCNDDSTGGTKLVKTTDLFSYVKQDNTSSTHINVSLPPEEYDGSYTNTSFTNSGVSILSESSSDMAYSELTTNPAQSKFLINSMGGMCNGITMDGQQAELHSYDDANGQLARFYCNSYQNVRAEISSSDYYHTIQTQYNPSQQKIVSTIENIDDGVVSTLEQTGSALTFSGDIISNGKFDLGDGATISKDSSNRVVISYANNAKVSVAGANTMFSNRIDPNNDNSLDIGRSSVRWKDLYLSGHLSDGNNSNYGLSLPNTTGWTANKTIATLDEVKLVEVTYGTTTFAEITTILAAGKIPYVVRNNLVFLYQDNANANLYVFSSTNFSGLGSITSVYVRSVTNQWDEHASSVVNTVVDNENRIPTAKAVYNYVAQEVTAVINTPV